MCPVTLHRPAVSARQGFPGGPSGFAASGGRASPVWAFPPCACRQPLDHSGYSSSTTRGSAGMNPAGVLTVAISPTLVFPGWAGGGFLQGWRSSAVTARQARSVVVMPTAAFIRFDGRVSAGEGGQEPTGERGTGKRLDAKRLTLMSVRLVAAGSLPRSSTRGATAGARRPLSTLTGLCHRPQGGPLDQGHFWLFSRSEVIPVDPYDLDIRQMPLVPLHVLCRHAAIAPSEHHPDGNRDLVHLEAPRLRERKPVLQISLRALPAGLIEGLAKHLDHRVGDRQPGQACVAP